MLGNGIGQFTHEGSNGGKLSMTKSYLCQCIQIVYQVVFSGNVKHLSAEINSGQGSMNNDVVSLKSSALAAQHRRRSTSRKQHAVKLLCNEVSSEMEKRNDFVVNNGR